MKISTTNTARGRIAMKVDDKKPSGWKEGDEIPQKQLVAEFDDNGNAEVEKATGEAMVAAVTGIKAGHNKVAPETPSEE